MKKFLSMMLAICILLSLSSTSLAATITEDTSQNANTTVRYGVDVSYTVTIPESVTIDASGVGSASYVVSDAMIPAGEHIYITTDSANRVEDTFYLTNIENDAVKIPYEISCDSTVWNDNMHTRTFVFNQDELIAGDVTRTINFRLLEDGMYSGTYDDVLTTTVAVGYAVYGARQFPEDESTIVWPEVKEDKLNENMYTIREEVNVWQSRTHEWYTECGITLWNYTYGASDSSEWLEFISVYRDSGLEHLDLYDAGYAGNFEFERVVYFGETFQLVSQDFYDFIMANTQPYNHYQPITGQYTMSGDFSLPVDDYVCIIDGTVNNTYSHVAFMRFENDGLPTSIAAYDEDYSDMYLLYMEGIGWVEPALAGDFDMGDPEAVNSFLASLVPVTTPHIIEFNQALIPYAIRDAVMSILTPIN